MRSVHLGWLAGMLLAIAIGRPAVSRAGGDATAGRAKAAACAGCHGPGEPTSDAPLLAGQGAPYLARQLAAFQRGDRVSPMMSAITRQLTAGDIADLAAFWAGQPAGVSPIPDDQRNAIRRPRMAFPAGFPAGFTRYRTSNNPDKQLVSSMYVNAIGLAAARANRDLPDGSVIVMINYAIQRGAGGKPVIQRDGSWATGQISSYSGMELRAGAGNRIPPLLRNADWSYNLFTAGKAAQPGINQAECLACHKAQAAVDYLFSFQELREAASAR